MTKKKKIFTTTALACLLAISFFAPTATAVVSVPNTVEIPFKKQAEDGKESQKPTLRAGANKPQTNPYSTVVPFDAKVITKLLNNDNFYHLNDTGFVIEVRDQNNNTKPTYETISISNPLQITTGCGTIKANLEDTLEVLLVAFSKSLKLLPAYFIRSVSGFPDTSNPKEVFEFIYDVSTSLICQTQSAVVSATEGAVSAVAEYSKTTFKTQKESNEDDAAASQLGHICALLATKDSVIQKKTNTTNTQANKKIAAAVGSGAFKAQSLQSNKCKQSFEDLKKTIQAKIKRLSLYEKQAAKENNSICKNIAKTPAKEKVIYFSPIYISGDALKEAGAEDLRVIPEFSSGITLSRGIFDNTSRQVGESPNSDKEVLVDRESLHNKIRRIEGKLRIYQKTRTNLTQTVYDIGIDYANTISRCINGFDENTGNPDTAGGWTSTDKDNCEKIEYGVETTQGSATITVNPFPMNFLRPADERGNPTNFLDIVEKKKLFCDMTLFAANDPSFLTDTIKFVTEKVIQKRTDNIPQESYLAAINEIILPDYCEIQLYSDIRYLEKKLLAKVEQLYEESNRFSEVLLLKMPTWKKNEIYFAPGTKYEGKKVVKICAKHSKSDVYYAAVLPAASEGADPLTWEEIEKQTTSIVKIKVDGDRPDDHIKNLSKNHLNEALVEEIAPSILENEMLCVANLDAATLDKQPGESSCPAKNLICGINFNKGNLSGRVDNLCEIHDKDGNITSQKAKTPCFSPAAEPSDDVPLPIYKATLEYFKKHRPKTPLSPYTFEKEQSDTLVLLLNGFIDLRVRSENVENLLIERVELELLHRLNNIRQ